MTSHHNRPAAQATTPDPAGGTPQYPDRVYRSVAGLCAGVLLLVLALWLGGDAVVHGKGHAPWLALASLLLAIPLIVAFTLRPAVYAGEQRLKVRNPFRTISVAWAGVESLRASFSNELFAGGKKYQIWAIPVSLRARKRATKQQMRAKAAGDDPFGAPPRRKPRPGLPVDDDGAFRSPSDQAIHELRELKERHGADDGSEPPKPEIRWAYEVIAPAVAGFVVLVVLLAIGG
ncbi:PH domain-containing protein [Streptomyces sp. NPDC088197]|uniref:PH domain-containing protein n=1 Tax=Streptomyces sp. NPDC088197 TaxID=3365840 RepID=UPI00381CC53A